MMRNVALILSLLSLPLSARAAPSVVPDAVIAIDVLIDPDPAMRAHAVAANARLLKSFPKGFTFDATHHPHLTFLQTYVRVSALASVYAAVGKVLTEEHPESWKLTAYGYDAGPWDGVKLAGIQVHRTDDLVRLQSKLLEAIAPFTAKSGTADAFFTTKSDPKVEPRIIDYVAEYASNGTGPKYKPHVTIGVASEESAGTLLAEKFDPFVWSPAGVSVYQLGSFGTARKRLKRWTLNS